MKIKVPKKTRTNPVTSLTVRTWGKFSPVWETLSSGKDALKKGKRIEGPPRYRGTTGKAQKKEEDLEKEAEKMGEGRKLEKIEQRKKGKRTEKKKL